MMKTLLFFFHPLPGRGGGRGGEKIKLKLNFPLS